MRFLLCACVMGISLSGCSLSSISSSSAPTATAVATVATPHVQTPTVRPAPRPTAVPSSQPYQAFVHSVCRAFAARDVTTLTDDLSHYQYNSGLRYGMLGDGEGQNGDPSLFFTWMSGVNVKCLAYTHDRGGHGTLLTVGWRQSGPAALIDLDTFNGVWKFNDFTFGNEVELKQVMGGSAATVPFQG